MRRLLIWAIGALLACCGHSAKAQSVSFAVGAATAPTGLPGDVGTPILIVGTKVLKTGYAGNAVSIIKTADGLTSNIGYASGVFDSATWNAGCANATLAPVLCRVTKAFDQSGSGNDPTAAETWLQTNASNAPGQTLKFASTTGVADGNPMDVNAINCDKIRAFSHDGTSVEGKTFDGEHPCGASSSTGVLFGVGPTMAPGNNLIGALPSIVFDWNPDVRKSVSTGQQALTLPSGVTFAHNNFTLVAVIRTDSCAGVGVLQLNGSGGNALALRFVQGAVVLHHVDATGTWVDSFTRAGMYSICGPTPHLVVIQSVAGGITLEIDGITLVNAASTRNDTLTGGTIGATNATNVEQISGGLELIAAMIWTPALSSGQLTTVKTATRNTTGMLAQFESPHIHIAADDRAMGSVVALLQDWPRQIAASNPLLRVTSMGATNAPGVDATTCNYVSVTNYPNFVTPFVNTAAKHNVGILAWSPNDYNQPSTDPAVQQACHQSAWSKMKADGFDVILELIYPTSTQFDQPQQDYNNAGGDWIVDNAPAAGVQVLDLRTDPFFPPSWASDQTLSQSGHDLTMKANARVAAKVMEKLGPLLH
jgi:hypothetical protein